MSQFLCTSHLSLWPVAGQGKQIPGFQYILLVNQDIQIAEFSQRNVTKEQSGQGWPLEGNSRDLVHFE
jgi:hypothetical protein